MLSETDTKTFRNLMPKCGLRPKFYVGIRALGCNYINTNCPMKHLGDLRPDCFGSVKPKKKGTKA